MRRPSLCTRAAHPQRPRSPSRTPQVIGGRRMRALELVRQLRDASPAAGAGRRDAPLRDLAPSLRAGIVRCCVFRS